MQGAGASVSPGEGGGEEREGWERREGGGQQRGEKRKNRRTRGVEIRREGGFENSRTERQGIGISQDIRTRGAGRTVLSPQGYRSAKRAINAVGAADERDDNSNKEVAAV